MIVKPGVITNWDLMEEQVQFYRDHLDIFIEDQFPPIKLNKTQHVIARAFGRDDDMKAVCSRGYGKTFLIALCAFAVCCLYPGTLVCVCSGTADQATLVFQKLKPMIEQNKNLASELVSNGRALISLQKEKGKIIFKNGSEMESFALSSMRGRRAKIVIIDEALEIDQEDLDAVVSPLKNFRRDISFNYNFKDFPSKSIAITSACEKSNTFYSDFVRVVRDMAKGRKGSFACALDYHCAADEGVTDMEYFEKERARMPAAIFDMEYGSIFQGTMSNSIFPYNLTEGCRTLTKVETEQPKNSKSRYVIALDIATSRAKEADNAVITVIKFNERTDGSFSKKLVNIRSFHGESLDILANEIRKVFHLQFPNAERIIYDARGLGDSFSKFLDEPWIDPSTGKEYPALVHDDGETVVQGALPVLHAIRAIQSLNERIANHLRVMFEKQTLELPMNSRIIREKRREQEKPLSMQETAIFMETDALQLELGNIVAKVSSAGNYIFDVPRATMHKDRYSSLAYGADYVAELEEQNMKRKSRGTPCVGIATGF